MRQIKERFLTGNRNKASRTARLASALAALALACGSTLHAQAPPVLQRGYDTGVSGATLSETLLNTSTVSPSTFGLLFKLPVDDRVYAQPLYVPNVAIAGQGTHNVAYIATMNDTLYAFDADAGTQLWSVNFASLFDTTAVPIVNFTFDSNQNIVGNLGILSTPVIDPSTHIMYLVACTLENDTLAYRLHAVDITTGAEPYGPGVLISGSYGGSTFEPRYQTQRESLTLSGGQVVIGFGAVEEEAAGAYVGWVIAYNEQTLQQSGIFATITTGTRGGGVWQSGRPPVVDSAGFVYVFVGNGYQNGYDGVNDFSESALKLDPANALQLTDWFTPSIWSLMDTDDLDLSSSGPLLIPDTSPTMIAGGGKTGILYLLNTTNLGHFNATDSNIVQEVTISAGSMRGGPVYWQRSAANGGPLLYDWGSSDVVKSYAFNGTTFATTAGSQGSSSQIYPGGILTLSANGEQHGSGVLWATVAASGDVFSDPTDPGVLHAFNAENLSSELWNSTMNSTRDNFGAFAKFVPPLVVNGKVYVATFSDQVAVYGLQPAATPMLSPTPGTYTGTQSVTLSDTTSGASIYYTTNGTTPSGTSAQYLSGTPLSISTTTKIEAIALASGFTNSAVASGTYTIGASFTLSAAPGTQSVVAGSATSYTASIGSVSGFTGLVTLSVSGLPTGAVASFSPTTVIGSGTSTLTVTTSGTTPVSTSTLTITGTSGSLSQMAGVALTVTAQPPPPSFTLSAGPGTQTVAAGNATSYTASVGAVSGFTGVVTLGVSGLPTGAVASFSPTTVSGSGTSTLTVTTSGTTPVSTSTLTIKGTSGSLTQTAGVTLSVTNAAAAAAIGVKFVGEGTAMASTEVAGVVAQSNWNDASGLSSAAPMVLVNQTGASSGASATWNTNGIYELAISDTPGNFRMMRGYLDTLGGTSTVTVAGLPTSGGGYNVYVYADGANNGSSRTGAYQISGTGITTTSVNLIDAANTDFSGTFTQANNSKGNYVIFPITAAATGFTITATPGVSSDAYLRAPLNAIQIVPQGSATPSFTLSAGPGTQTVVAGNAASYTTSIAAMGGFTGTVALSVSGLPAGAVATFSPTMVSGSGTSTLTVTTSGTTPVSTSTLTITGTSGSLTQAAAVTLSVTNAAAIGIKFVGEGTPMASTEVAGVVAQSNWNDAGGLSSAAPLVLVNQTGASSGASVAWNTNGIYDLAISDTPGNFRMMRGYLDTVGATTTVAVAGLPTNARGYSVYVYADGANNGSNRTAAYQISGTGITATSVNLIDAANTDFSGTFTQANNSNGNYVLFSITATANGFTITATPGASSDAYSRAPLNAIQIVPN
jgi:hypothetical protein